MSWYSDYENGYAAGLSRSHESEREKIRQLEKRVAELETAQGVSSPIVREVPVRAISSEATRTSRANPWRLETILSTDWGELSIEGDDELHRKLINGLKRRDDEQLGTLRLELK